METYRLLMFRPFRVPMEASISRSKRPSYLNSGARKIRTPSLLQNLPRDWIMSANGSTDKEAYHNFGMALHGSANIWLESMVTLQK
jgi:hypothetical protein